MAKRFFSYFRDERNIRYDIEIWDSSFSGTTTEFQTRSDGFNLRYAGQGNERTAPVVGSECRIIYLMQNETDEEIITDLITAAEGRFTLLITKGDTPVQFWVGMILPDIGKYNEEYYPIDFEIKATDGLGLLKDIKFKDTSAAYAGKDLLIKHLTKALSKLPYVATHFDASAVFVRSAVDWWETTMTNDPFGADALNFAYVDHSNWLKYTKGVEDYYSCYDVVVNILTTLGARIKQAEGAFWIEQLSYRTASTIVTRRYSKSGTFLSSANFATNNTIDQTLSGALIAVGQYEFFPALSKSEHIFKEYLRRNFLSGVVPLDDDNVSGQVVYKPIKKNNNQTTLRLTGSMVVRISSNDPDPSYMSAFKPFALVFRLNLQLDSEGLSRTYVQSPNFQITYGPPEWIATPGYYVLLPITSGPFMPNVTSDTFTFTQAFDIMSPPLNEDCENFSVSLLLEGIRKFDGTTYSTGDFDITFELNNPWLEIYSYGTPALSEDEAEYTCLNTIQTTNSVVHEMQSLVGTATDPNTLGALWVKPASDYILATNWGDGTDPRDRYIEYLLTEFIVSGQATPIKRLTGTLFGDIVAARRVFWLDTYWLLLGGSYNAARNEFAGEWVELKYLPGLSTSPPRRRKLTNIDPPVPPAPTTGNDKSGITYEIVAKPPGTLFYTVSQATTGIELYAGAITSLPVSAALEDGDFGVGDVIRIVNPFTGWYEDLLVGTTSVATDMAIDVSGTLEYEYPANAPIIRKAATGVYGLPPGQLGEILRHNGLRWEPYGIGLTTGWVLTLDATNRWVAAALPASVSGSGTTNRLAKWTSSTALGNSTVYEVSGNVGIGVASPNAPLTVIGTSGDSIIFGYSEIKFLGSGIANNSIKNNVGGVKGLYVGNTDSTADLGATFTAYAKIGGATESEFYQLLKLVSLQITTGAAAGRVLQSDAVGLASWVDQWIKDGAVSGLWTNVATVTVGGTSGSKLVLRNADSGTSQAANDAYNVLVLQPHVATANNWAAIAGYSAAGAIAGDIAFRIVDHTNHYADVVISTRNAGGYAHRMWIKSSGNVGIGTNSPAEVLDIVGNLRFSGALMPNGAAGAALSLLVSADAGSPPTWLAKGTALQYLRVNAANNALEYATLTALTGTLTATRIPFATSASALSDDALLTWDNATKRLSVGNTGGSPAASVHIAEGAVSSWEPLRAAGTVSGNMIVTFLNAFASGGAGNMILDLSVGGATAGDAMIRWLVTGVGTWSMGPDTSAASWMRLKYQTTPSAGTNTGITLSTDAATLVGINNDSPAHPLDVVGRARATLVQGVSGTFSSVFGAGAGTTPTLTSLVGTSNGFRLQFSTGTTPTTDGNIISITLPTSYTTTMYVTFSPNTKTTAANIGSFFVSARTNATFTLTANGTLPASTPFDLDVITFGR